MCRSRRLRNERRGSPLLPHVQVAVPMQRIGTHHNALHDAESQAQHLIDNALAFGIQIN